mgnify:CR=1 FL=1
MDVAKSISEGLARNVISASYNGTTIETTTTLTTDGTLILYTWNDKEGKKAFWHSTSHVMAQALEEIFPGIKLTLGPAIDNGFYYDVDFGDKKIEVVGLSTTHMATIQDIADRLGVSKGTVSKAINNAPDISETLRKTVLDTAVEMGYTRLRRQKNDAGTPFQ